MLLISRNLAVDPLYLDCGYEKTLRMRETKRVVAHVRFCFHSIGNIIPALFDFGLGLTRGDGFTWVESQFG